MKMVGWMVNRDTSWKRREKDKMRNIKGKVAVRKKLEEKAHTEGKANINDA